MLMKLWNALTDNRHRQNEPKEYRKLEIEATIKCNASDLERPFRLHLKVLDKGSFFTSDIFIEHADERIRCELFYNYSTLGMSGEELERCGATDDAEYGFATLEEAKKAKEATVQYIRFLCGEHQETVQGRQKIS